jgi:hypothetical protein
MTTPLAQIFNDVSVAGVTKRKVIRTKDATIRTLKAGYIYVDADDGGSGTFDPQTQVGASLFGGWRWFWTGTDITVAASSIFNNRSVFKGAIRPAANYATHHFSIPDPPALVSYTAIVVLSLPAIVLTEAAAFTLGNRYAFARYNPVSNTFEAGLQFFGNGAQYGWQVNPGPPAVSGNPLTITAAAFPAAIPTADTPFIIAWTLDAPTLTSKFYYRDGATPITSKVHAQVSAGGGDIRYYPMSFSIGSNVASWEGNEAMLLIHDDSNPATKMTDAQRIAVMSDLRAWYGIV